MKHNCEIINCSKKAVQAFFKYPNGKLWLCQEHTDEELDLDEGKEWN